MLRGGGAADSVDGDVEDENHLGSPSRASSSAASTASVACSLDELRVESLGTLMPGGPAEAAPTAELRRPDDGGGAGGEEVGQPSAEATFLGFLAAEEEEEEVPSPAGVFRTGPADAPVREVGGVGRMKVPVGQRAKKGRG